MQHLNLANKVYLVEKQQNVAALQHFANPLEFA